MYHIYEHHEDGSTTMYFANRPARKLDIARTRLINIARRSVGKRLFCIWKDFNPIIWFTMRDGEWSERPVPQQKREDRERDLEIEARRRRTFRMGFRKGDLTYWIKKEPAKPKK